MGGGGADGSISSKLRSPLNKNAAAVRDAAVEAGKYNIQLARDGMTGDVPPVHKTIEGFGVKIVKLSDAERAAFKKVTQPTYDKWAKQIGPDLVKKAEAAVAARKK